MCRLPALAPSILFAFHRAAAPASPAQYGRGELATSWLAGEGGHLEILDLESSNRHNIVLLCILLLHMSRMQNSPLETVYGHYTRKIINGQ